jgi:hypothetical protein
VDKRQARAFETLAAESGAELLRIAALLTSDPHIAEDVYQGHGHSSSPGRDLCLPTTRSRTVPPNPYR